MDWKDYEKEEYKRADSQLCLIASENYPPQDILDACGSIFSLRYTEGFPGKRYYQGCEIVDKMEQDCIDSCLKLFNASDEYYANVQPNSGASANMIVYNSILEPGDVVLAPDVKCMGHISHSHPKSFISKYHNVYTYNVSDDGCLDYEAIRWQALNCMPKLIICGASNYSREIDFRKFKEIADEVGAKLMADIAHISLLCAHNLHQTPVDIADFITFTTHKMLAGPRGGCIIYKKEYDKAIRLSTIPSLFGGPLQHQIYGKLICFKNAITDKYEKYAKNILENAKTMAQVFNDVDIPIVTGKTENHLMTIDLTNFNISGKELAVELNRCGVVANCNTIPNDPRSFLETSGVRLGTPAITMRGLDTSDVLLLTLAMSNLINCYRKGNEDEISEDKINTFKTRLLELVQGLTKRYPLSNIYNIGKIND